MLLAVKRFTKYFAIGFSTFLLDLVLLYILTDIFSINYVLTSGIAFLIAFSINYIFSRKYVFKGSLRGVKSGYFNFLAIGITGLSVVMGGMYVFVTLFGFNYLASRFLIATITGLWNYLMNLYVNFKVVGIH